jgi:acyl-coenzyme A synthetase/AMP-(fatty) acid ligase
MSATTAAKPQTQDWTFFQKMTQQGFYKLEVPEELNMARLIVDWWAEEGGRADDVAIYDEDSTITYGKLKELTDAFASALYKLGVRKGDKFVLRVKNCPEYMVAFLGGQKIGAVPIPVNPMLREYEVSYIAQNSESIAMVTNSDMTDFVEKIRPEWPTLKHVILVGEAKPNYLSYEKQMAEHQGSRPPLVMTHKDDPAYYLYTSGTTAGPKGVVHAHRFIIGAGDPIGKFTMALERGDITGGPTALTWMYALGHSFLFSFRWGTSVAIWRDVRFEAERAMEFAQKYKLTHFVGTPTIYRFILAAPDLETKYDLSRLKYFLSSGEPLLEHTVRELNKRFGVRCVDSMGQTEAHEFCTSQTHIPLKVGSMGKPLPGIEVAIVDDAGNTLPPGEIGHLAIRTDHPALFLEYFRMPETQKDVMLPNQWYDTKDLASMDEDGYFWYCSRSDDIMTSRGYRISPAEVENALCKHPSVLEAGVAGAFDPEVGEKVKAWVVLQKNVEPSENLVEELIVHVKNTIAPYKHPQLIEFVAELPKTSSGKILRKDLRKAEREKHGIMSDPTKTRLNK